MDATHTSLTLFAGSCSANFIALTESYYDVMVDQMDEV